MFKRSKEPEKKGSEKREDLLVSFLKDAHFVFAIIGYYAPLVELNFKYKKAIFYQSQPEIIITYIPTESAKIVFEYEIRDKVSGETFATGRSVQVFTGFDHQLVWESPEFYRNWQKKWEVL